MRYARYITRKVVQDNPDTLYVFGDNMIGHGFGGQAKEMRGEPNVVGIPTKNYPGIQKQDYFSDGDFPAATIKIALAFVRLFEHVRQGGQIVWPYDGIGTGMADLQNKSPKIWAFIEENRLQLEKLARK